jgi:hypothetical protein
MPFSDFMGNKMGVLRGNNCVSRPTKVANDPPTYEFTTPKYTYHVKFICEFICDEWVIYELFFAPLRRGKLNWTKRTHEGLHKEVYARVRRAMVMFIREHKPDVLVLTAYDENYMGGFKKTFSPTMRRYGYELRKFQPPIMEYHSPNFIAKMREFARKQAAYYAEQRAIPGDTLPTCHP